jgi:hypothetical protein
MATQLHFSEKLGKNVKLGRLIPKVKPQVLHLKRYLVEGAVTPPRSVDYHTKASESIKQMLGNDQYGDCVIAGELHALGVYSANDKDSGGVRVATTDEAVSQYHQICGSGDNGCNIADVLNHHRDAGLKIGNETHKIDGYLAIDNTNKLEVQVALILFGPLTIGLSLPSKWMNTGEGDLWDVTNWPIIGGHEVIATGYDDVGVTISTWGGLRKITWAAFTSSRWIDELYLKLAPLWYGPDKISPAQIDVDTLKADLQKIKDGVIPPIDPTPVVPPKPPTPPAPPAPQGYTGVGKATATYKDFFGSTKTMELTLTAVDVELLPKLKHRIAEATEGLEGFAFDWALVLKLATAAVTTVLMDLQAGKTPLQITEDVVAAVLAVLTGKQSESVEHEAKMSTLVSVDWFLVIKISLAISAVLISDIRAGKTPVQIAEDIAAAVLGMIPAQ